MIATLARALDESAYRIYCRMTGKPEGILPRPSIHAGVKFRSRLEAQWAHFFDLIGIEWSYEPQRFTLPCGTYLPDFWLPAQKLWVEIKPDWPLEIETTKCRELSAKTDQAVFCFCGPPTSGHAVLFSPDGAMERKTLPRSLREHNLAQRAVEYEYEDVPGQAVDWLRKAATVAGRDRLREAD